ncbi:MAG: ATP-binding protein [Candidatus Eisenbacteria bacterium]
MNPRQIVLRCDSRLDHVELLSRAVRAMCSASNMDLRSCARVELALVEAANNSVRHAYLLEAGHPLEVTFTLFDDHFKLEVSDEGSPMPERPAPVLDFDPTDIANLPTGGMGLFLIHSVMDQVEYKSVDGRNTLAMTKRTAE